MRTRAELTTFLDSIPYETISSVNKNDGSYIFHTQIEAAKKVIVNLACNELRTNHVILIAKMQSGKTGTCNAIANLVMNTSLKNEMCINKVLYLTGMNDCGLSNQTYDRVIEQVTGATQQNTVDSFKKRLPTLSTPEYYVLKNSNLRSFTNDLNGSLIFIDESHFGSKELNVLTSFMKEKGIDWKNKNSLISNNIYIVSVSATPFDEIVSDIIDCKPMVELETDDNYVGVSEYFERDMIFPATKDDVKTGIILDYLQEAYDRMVENSEKGIVIIRTRDFDYFCDNGFVKDKFNIFKMDASGSKIDYDNLNLLTDKLIAYNHKTNKNDYLRRGKNIPVTLNDLDNQNPVKPVLVLIKGAFRAGITIKPKIKDLIYMIYDFSTDANATAQALLGRMCGYRDLEHCSFNTKLYVNAKFARMYAEWEKNFTNKHLIPSSRTKWVWISNDYEGYETKLGTKSCGNFTIDLNFMDLKEICELSQCSERKCAEKAEQVINKIFVRHHIDVKYDYFFEAYMKGKNYYAKSTQERRFESFSTTSVICQFRPEISKKFRNDTGRDYISKEDLGKKGICVVFDSTIEINKVTGNLIIGGNRRLLVYYFEVGQQKQMANHECLYCMHKDTTL